MEKHMIAIASVIVLLLRLTECGKCPYAKFDPNHSFCKTPNPKCNILERGLKPADKQRLIDLHNTLREKVASGKETQAGKLPTAANMLEMVWDDELASVAQKWAEQCIFNHDCKKCRQVDSFQQVGQNLALTAVSPRQQKQYFDSMVDSWYNEVSEFNKRYVKAFVYDEKYGHFTQLVWADTWKLGCGFVLYLDDGWYISFLVCNYGPSGNMRQAQMYKTGKTCSACPTGSCCGADCTRKFKKTAKYSSLCMMVNAK